MRAGSTSVMPRQKQTDGIRRGAATLAEDAERAREAHDVVHGEEVRLVVQLLDQLELVLDRRPHGRGAYRRASGRRSPSAVSLRSQLDGVSPSGTISRGYS